MQTALDQLRSIVALHHALPKIPALQQLQTATARQQAEPSALSDADQVWLASRSASQGGGREGGGGGSKGGQEDGRLLLGIRQSL